MNYFISDLHFGHKNVLAFDNRPFDNIEQHDNALIRNWNNAVNIDDDVYILGDISWHNATRTLEIFNTLNGNLHLIKGNHDIKLLKGRDLRERFVEITDYKELSLEDGGKKIVLSHYPIPCFNHRYEGWIHLYGHVHNSTDWNTMEYTKRILESRGTSCNMYNVGVMMSYMDYTPRILEDIIHGYNRWIESCIYKEGEEPNAE